MGGKGLFVKGEIEMVGTTETFVEDSWMVVGFKLVFAGHGLNSCRPIVQHQAVHI